MSCTKTKKTLIGDKPTCQKTKEADTIAASFEMLYFN